MIPPLTRPPIPHRCQQLQQVTAHTRTRHGNGRPVTCPTVGDDLRNPRPGRSQGRSQGRSDDGRLNHGEAPAVRNLVHIEEAIGLMQVMDCLR